MTALDMIVLLLVGGSAVLGVMRGFVTEMLSLGAWVLAIIAVKAGHEPLTYALTPSIGTESGAAVLAFALIFGVTMIAGRIAARSIGKKSRQSVVGGFDRILGLGFGAIKGFVIASFLFLLASLIINTIYGAGSERPEWMTESRSFPLLNAGSRALVDFVEDQQRDGGLAS